MAVKSEIYIVMSRKGQIETNPYMDERAVCAYLDYDMAEAHATQAEMQAARLKRLARQTEPESEPARSRFTIPADDEAKVWDEELFGSTRQEDELTYYVIAVPLLTTLPGKGA